VLAVAGCWAVVPSYVTVKVVVVLMRYAITSDPVVGTGSVVTVRLPFIVVAVT
jgi:hypothetical protein